MRNNITSNNGKQGSLNQPTCSECGEVMIQAAGCTVTRAYCTDRGENYTRQLVTRVTHDGRCHDCGAKAGHPHHPGCDMEYCPLCQTQLLMCHGYEPAVPE